MMRWIPTALAIVLAMTGRVEAAGAAGPLQDPKVRAAVEDQGRQLVEAINTGDEARRTRIVREVFLAASLAEGREPTVLAQLGRLRADLGTLEFHHAEAVAFGDGASARVSLHVYAKSGKDGGWRDLQLRLDPTPPHRIQNLVFIASVTEPVYLPNGDVTSAETLEWLGGYIDKLAAEDDLSGGLLLAHGDDILFEREFGFADTARRHPLTPATRFSLASGGKMFTAVAIASLVEQGALHFTDTLDKVLPAVAKEPFASRITLAHLLSHTSGIGEYWNADYEAHARDLGTLSDFLPFVLDAGIDFPAGEQFRYSNSNYILLGLVLEAVTGRTYDEVLAERVRDPADMKESGLLRFDDADPGQAVRFVRDGKRWAPVPGGGRGSSAGGALATTHDMLRFARALAGGRLVSKSMLAEMTTSRTAGLPASSMAYGYGFEIGTSPRETGSFGHGGIARGVNFELRYFPESDITLIAFSNQDNGAYDDLRKNTTRLVTGER